MTLTMGDFKKRKNKMHFKICLLARPKIVSLLSCSLFYLVMILYSQISGLEFKILLLDGEKVSDYEMKLMDLDTEHLGIPVSNYV